MRVREACSDFGVREGLQSGSWGCIRDTGSSYVLLLGFSIQACCGHADTSPLADCRDPTRRA